MSLYVSAAISLESTLCLDALAEGGATVLAALAVTSRLVSAGEPLEPLLITKTGCRNALPLDTVDLLALGCRSAPQGVPACSRLALILCTRSGACLPVRLALRLTQLICGGLLLPGND